MVLSSIKKYKFVKNNYSMKGFPPIINKNISILILGSFPSKASLVKQEYYGHPHNQFWKILGKILNEELYSADYKTKKDIVLKHNIGIWDVIDGCDRKSSLDSDIKNEQPNNLNKIKKLAPNLKIVCFNGKKAGSYESVFKEYKTFVLPSTSPAYTLKYAEKLKFWKKAIKK